jgi:hypothetical protein
MSILINAECRLSGYPQPLTGGREFFDSLVTSVSRYAQEFLSGVHRPFTQNGKPALVQLHKINNQLHRLTVQPSATTDTASGNLADHHLETDAAQQISPTQVDLTTVQLFDLVEAVDQFFADTRTLPDLSLQLAPVPKRYATARKPVATRAVPVAVGVSSLALAAIAFFFIPIPEVRRPSDPRPQPNSSQPTGSPTNATQASSGSGQPNLSEVEAALTSAPEITDPNQLDSLSKKLYDQINQAWKTDSTFDQDLIYRVGMSQDGAIIGYKPVNQAATDNAKQTPLLDLLYIPAEGSAVTQEPLAQFKVVFTSKGALEVSPWKGYTAEPTSRAEISDPAQIEAMTTNLYNQLDQTWKTTPTFERNLVYSVRLRPDGAIAEYEPVNQPAFDYVDETPLPEIAKSAIASSSAPQTANPSPQAESSNSLTADGSRAEASGSPTPKTGATNQEPLGHFKVVFTPKGVLEVSPWRGYQE